MMSPMAQTKRQTENNCMEHKSPISELTSVSAIDSNTNGNDKQQFHLSVNGQSDTSSEPSTPPDPAKSQCSSLSDGESFECFGENEMMSSTVVGNIHNGNNDTTQAVNGGVDLELAPHFQSEPDKNSMLRHTWARTSLRGLRGSMKRPLGSNALANHLYRSSSFNSSGRSSNCDTTEDMYSDVSLEDVQDLNHKLNLLQRQVTNLADTQMTTEDRTTRAKTEHAVIQARYHMLEEQLRETELRSEERLHDQQKHYRELLARVEREAQLKNDNCQIRLEATESEMQSLRDDIHKLRMQFEKQSVELEDCENKLDDTRFKLSVAQESLIESRNHEKRHLADKASADQTIIELHKEIERMRAEFIIVRAKKSMNHQISASSLSLESNASEIMRIEELQNELEDVKKRNRQLEEMNEELQAMLLNKGIEEGRNLLNGGTPNLADELKEMGQVQLQTAYQEKAEECQRLKRYIDTMLLNVVENHPQLLEIKTSPSAS